ncbi:hypothetical protein TNCV_3063961 [Trichonephila clavipes]|nr:hypothetical protein TNCV_3063961 [Trichonephila clavipes]
MVDPIIPNRNAGSEATKAGTLTAEISFIFTEDRSNVGGRGKETDLKFCIQNKGYRFTEMSSKLDTLRENCGIIRKQASTDGGVLWEVVRVNVVQVR